MNGLLNDQELLHSSELKRSLVHFAKSSRFHAALRDWFKGFEKASDEEAVGIMDDFILEWRDPAGKGVIELYLELHPRLPSADRRAILEWKDSLVGVFLVQELNADHVLAQSLIDDLSYKVQLNLGNESLPRHFTLHGFFVARLVRSGDAWLISGGLQQMAPEDHLMACGFAAELALRDPRLVYRNPSRIEEGRAVQLARRPALVQALGGDELVGTGREIENALRALESEGDVGGRPSLPRELQVADDLALLVREDGSWRLVRDYGRYCKAFQDPHGSISGPGRALVEDLLTNRVEPWVIDRIARKDIGSTNRLLEGLLEWPGFSWEEQGERLLAQSKPWFDESSCLPTAVPLSESLLEGLRALRRRAVSHSFFKGPKL